MPANKAYVLGLTGGIASGKSEAAKILKALGAKHVDADAISRELTAKDGAALSEIRAVFDADVFEADGTLNRRALGTVVFSDPKKKRVLEGIQHPMIRQRMEEEIRTAGREGYAVALLDVPLLFEAGMDGLCDEVWTLSVDERTQIRRIVMRDGLTETQARARIAA